MPLPFGIAAAILSADVKPRNALRWGRARLGAAVLAVVLATEAWCAPAWRGAVLPALSIRGRRYVGSKSLRSFYGFPNMETGRDRVRFRSQWTSVDLEADHRKAEVNGIVVWLGFAPATHRGDIWISQDDVASTIDPLLRPRHPEIVRRYPTVMLDPGHGGKDVGAQSKKGGREKDLVLDLAKRLERILEKRGVRVVWTRSSDRTVSLDARVALAKKARPDLFVSLHCNAARATDALGIETYCLTPKGLPSTASSRPDSRAFGGNRHDRANVILAYQVQRSLVRATSGKDRGVRRARFQVLKEATCPAVLVEVGFLSNPSEAQRIASSSHRDLIAQAVDTGIRSFEATLAP